MPTPQRILLICNSYPPETGAAPVRMEGLAHLLLDAGYEVAVMCGMPNYPTGAVFPEYRDCRGLVTEDVRGIKVFRVPFLPSQSPKRWVRMGSLASLSASVLRRGGDIFRHFRPHRVIISTPPLPLALCGAWLARRYQVPMLLNVSDLWPLTAKELGALHSGPLYSLLEKAERWLFAQAQGWMGQSEEILRYIQQHSETEKPAFLYRNLPRYLGPSLQRTPLPADRRRIVYAGLIGPVQGLLRIVQEIDFANLNLELHIYGEGADRQRLQQYLEQHPNRGVVLHGVLPFRQMLTEMQDYDAALVSLKKVIYGAVPSKLFAAAAVGLPVLFSANGEGSMLVEKHTLGWSLPPGDIPALTQALRDFSSCSADDLARLRSEVQETALREFDHHLQDAAFLRFFKSLQVSGKTFYPEVPKAELETL